MRIGVTGHRPNRLKVPETQLRMQVRAVLKRLMKIARSDAPAGAACLEVISPLAEGCDRIVAHEALALGQQLTAVIPFARRDYEKTFSAPDAPAEFRALWNAARRKIDIKGNPKRQRAAYLAVGNVTVARADIILTIWDGKAAAGRGGTPEILQTAIDFGIPIVWIHATKNVGVRMLLPPAGGGGILELAKGRQKLSFDSWIPVQTGRPLK